MLREHHLKQHGSKANASSSVYYHINQKPRKIYYIMKSVARPESNLHLPNRLFNSDKAETNRDFELIEEGTVKKNKKTFSKTQNHTIPTIKLQLLDASSPKNPKQVTKTINKPEIQKRKLNKIILNPNAFPQKYSYSIYNANYLMSECNLNSYKNILESYFTLLQRELSYDTEICNKCCFDSSYLGAIFEVMLDLYNCYINEKYHDFNCILSCNKQIKVTKGKCGKKLKEIPHSTPTEKRVLFIHLKAKTVEQKEKIFKHLAKNIFSLSTEESKSYKNLLNEICKLKHNEKILKYFDDSGPLSKGETKLDKNLLNKIRANYCLLPKLEPQSYIDKYIKATDTAILLSLEGKSSEREEEKTIREFNKYRILLPEGLTRSQVYQLKRESLLLLKLVPSQTMLANYAEPTTSLRDKMPSLKEQILRDCAINVNLLPEGTSKSEKNIINKNFVDFGLLPKPKSRAMNRKYEKAAAAGLIQPLDGKSPKQKVTILQGLYERGVPLPIARTPSENIIIKLIKGEPKKLFKSKKSNLSEKALINAVSKDERSFQRRKHAENRPFTESSKLINVTKLNSFTQTSIENIKKDQHFDDKMPVEKENIFRRFIRTVLMKNKTPLAEDSISSISSIISRNEHAKPPKSAHKLTQTDENTTPAEDHKKMKSILRHSHTQSGTSLQKEQSTLSKSKIPLVKDSRSNFIEHKNQPTESSKLHKLTQVSDIITPLDDNTEPKLKNILKRPRHQRLSSGTALSKKRSKKKKVKIVRWNPKTSVVTRASSDEEPILTFDASVGITSKEDLTNMVSTDINLPHEAQASAMKSRPIVIGSSGELLSLQSIISLEEDDSLYIVRNMCGTHMFLNNSLQNQ